MITDPALQFSVSIRCMREQVYDLIASVADHKGIAGRSRSTRDLDGKLGEILQMLTQMQEWGPPLPVPLAECPALLDNVVILKNFRRRQARKGSMMNEQQK